MSISITNAAETIDKGRTSSAKYREFGDKLSLRIKLFYSFGHVYNDLCASIWFSYTLLYFKLSFDDTTAGLLLFLGQVADAISTPLIGYFSDKNFQGTVFGRYGRRKIWHLIGSVFVTASFPFIFNSCVLCSASKPWEKFIYYSIFITLFQFGWAAVQVSHVSLITDLTNISSERVELNSYRQAATVAASICVYTITLVLLGVEDSTITASDSIIFMKVVHLITFIGIVFTFLFHIFVSEPQLPSALELAPVADDDLTTTTTTPTIDIEKIDTVTATAHDDEEKKVAESVAVVVVEPSDKDKKHRPNRDERIWSDWLCSINFWKICFIYMMSRLYVNVTQVYTPLYLQETLRLAKRNIAIVPLIIYLGALVSSLVGKTFHNSRMIMCGGLSAAFASCLWIYLSNLAITIWEVFAVAAVFGIGGTLMLIGSLSLTADLINHNKISGAFVFGMMSFFDKFVNGGVIALVQNLKPANSMAVTIDVATTALNSTLLLSSSSSVGDHRSPPSPPSSSLPPPTVFYLNVLVFVSGAAVIVTFVSLFLIMKKQIAQCWRWMKG